MQIINLLSMILHGAAVCMPARYQEAHATEDLTACPVWKQALCDHQLLKKYSKIWDTEILKLAILQSPLMSRQTRAGHAGRRTGSAHCSCGRRGRLPQKEPESPTSTASQAA